MSTVEASKQQRQTVVPRCAACSAHKGDRASISVRLLLLVFLATPGGTSSLTREVPRLYLL